MRNEPVTIDVPGFPLGPAEVTLEVDGGRYPLARLPSYLSATWQGGDAAWSCRVTNMGDSPVRLGNLVCAFPATRWPAAVTAANTCQLLRPWFNVMVPSVHRLDAPAATTRSSWGMTALRRGDTGEAVVLGVLAAVCETEYRIRYADTHKQGAFGLEIRFDLHVRLDPGQSRQTPPLAVLGGAPVEELLLAYAARWAAAVPPRPRQRITGWSSWDFFGGSVRQQDVVENAPLAVRHLPGSVWAIIDDGWQTRWGEWTMTDRFPGGLEETAAAIARSGAQAGIWSAPLAMYMHCPFAREHRECCVRDDDGNIAYFTFTSGPVVMLDPSHPRVREYLRETYARIRAAGFRYFKLDFSQQLFLPPCRRFHDPTLTRLEIAALAIDTIREAVGEEAIMASGTFPYELLGGRFDSARATSDIHLYWTHIRQCGIQLAAGYWMDGAMFTLDPDFLIVRSPTTSTDEYRKYLGPDQHIPLGADWWQAGAEATEGELIVLATLVALAGGDFILGDRLATLNERGWAIIQRALETHCDRCARPLDVWSRAATNEPPALWQGESRGRTIVAAINWSDVPAALALPALPPGAVDVWTGRAATATVTLPPHTAALYCQP
jgi:hypothetical protein